MLLPFFSLSLLGSGCHCDVSEKTCPEKGACDHTFTLMVYNVENLFDLDGIAIFDEYVQDAEKNPYPYTAAKFLTKVNHAAEMIRECNGGAGPDILAIEEFENDFTQDPSFDLRGALESHKDVSLESLLSGDVVDKKLLGYPVEFFLMKRLEELGVEGYHFYQPRYDPTWFDRGIAHRSVFLSRFEAKEMHQYPVESARDIFEVTFDVHGNDFTVFNNHWKSGASSPRSEPTRVQNAGVLRSILDRRLEENPNGDIVMVGDFNSHHNQSLRMGDSVVSTGLNTVLRSQSNEQALVSGTADLYNLWYEVPQQQRGSEVWAGEWGTLMQIMVTPGLYNGEGVQYVDGSFHRLEVVGKNVSESDHTPVSWINLGKGAGYSDHLPVVATFRYASEDSPLEALEADKLGNEHETAHIRIPVDTSLEGRKIHLDTESLQSMTVDELLGRIGELFYVEGRWDGSSLEIGEATYGVYVSHPEARDIWKGVAESEAVSFVGRFGIYRGQFQFVVEDPSWLSWTPEP